MIIKTEAIRKSGGVRRFHTHRVVCEDTVASHSWGVAVVVDVLFNHNPPVKMLQAALYHDMSERKYGDIPSPSKRWLKSEKLREAEDTYVREFGFPVVELNKIEGLQIKAADIIDGFMFCFDEYERGNKTLVPVAETYLIYFSEMLYKMERLVPNFNDSDEIAYVNSVEFFDIMKTYMGVMESEG